MNVIRYFFLLTSCFICITATAQYQLRRPLLFQLHPIGGYNTHGPSEMFTVFPGYDTLGTGGDGLSFSGMNGYISAYVSVFKGLYIGVDVPIYGTTTSIEQYYHERNPSGTASNNTYVYLRNVKSRTMGIGLLYMSDKSRRFKSHFKLNYTFNHISYSGIDYMENRYSYSGGSQTSLRKDVSSDYKDSWKGGGLSVSYGLNVRITPNILFNIFEVGFNSPLKDMANTPIFRTYSLKTGLTLLINKTK